MDKKDKENSKYDSAEKRTKRLTTSDKVMALKRKNNNLFNLEDNEKEEENDEMTIAVSKKGAQKNKVFFEFNPYDTELTNALFDKTL